MLFDSGAEMDTLSPDFVHVCQVPLMELPNPLVLQMGTKGSQSCIYYGTNVNLKILGHSTSHYFNIVNVEKYDAILGAPWLNTTGTLLDFDKHIVHVKEGMISMFNVITEHTYRSMGSRACQAKLGVAPHTIGSKRVVPDSWRWRISILHQQGKLP